VLALLIPLSWMAVETSIDLSSHDDFCGQCHTMTPMVKAYRQSEHGGTNPVGFKAKCTDCHVSHENLALHLLGKAESGSHDIWVEFTADLTQIDWLEKRNHRERFVYDSGCLTCHQNLEKATMGNTKAFIAHRPYLRGLTQKQCVSCHPHIGHMELSTFIAEK